MAHSSTEPASPGEDRSVVLDHVLTVMGSAYVGRATWNGVELPVWIALCRNPELVDTHCIMTVGLSLITPLVWTRSGRPASTQELAMIVRAELDSGEEVYDVLTALAADAVEKHRVLDRRWIVARANQPATSRLTHAMVLNGSPLPSELGHVGDGREFGVSWILLLSQAEAEYGRSKGVSRLMFLLRWSDTDVFDLSRDSVRPPAGMTIGAFVFGGDAGDPDEECDRILAVVEGEPERSRLVNALLSSMRSASDQVRQCATEAIEALASSEPESFTTAQADAVEALLVDGLRLGDDGAPAEADALEAIRHARQHIQS